MTTPARDNTAGHGGALRDGRGRFRSLPANADRDAKAAELSARGWSYEAIAAQCGFSDRAGAWRAVQRVLMRTHATVGLREAKLRQLAELEQLRTKLWATVDTPPPLTDRLGRIVVDPETGEPVPDEAARQGAAALIIRASEREARLQGTDAPRTSMSVEARLASISPEDLREYLRSKQAAIAATEAEFGDPGQDAPTLPGSVDPC